MADIQINTLAYAVMHGLWRSATEKSGCAEIVSALLRTERLGLGPKQFAVTLQEFFISIGWLVNRIDTQFVAWLKYYQIMDAAADNLQHVRKNPKMDTLKLGLRNTFQFENSIGIWEDRRDFYIRNDSQKINPGIKHK